MSLVSFTVSEPTANAGTVRVRIPGLRPEQLSGGGRFTPLPITLDGKPNNPLAGKLGRLRKAEVRGGRVEAEFSLPEWLAGIIPDAARRLRVQYDDARKEVVGAVLAADRSVTPEALYAGFSAAVGPDVARACALMPSPAYEQGKALFDAIHDMLRRAKDSADKVMAKPEYIETLERLMKELEEAGADASPLDPSPGRTTAFSASMSPERRRRLLSKTHTGQAALASGRVSFDDVPAAPTLQGKELFVMVYQVVSEALDSADDSIYSPAYVKALKKLQAIAADNGGDEPAKLPDPYSPDDEAAGMSASMTPERRKALLSKTRLGQSILNGR